MSRIIQLKKVAGIVTAIVTYFTSYAAVAAETVHQAVPWQTGLQPAASPTMERISSLYSSVTFLVVAIAFFVLGLLIYVVIKFNAKANPIPSKTTHNTLLEVIWTAIPVIIVAVIAVPSIKLVYFADRTVDAGMTLKIVGHQWYWSYVYPDQGEFTFDSSMLDEDELEGKPRLLAVDNEVVLPIKTNIRLIMTSEDVIHAWSVPSLGVKLDTVPGRLNETWVRADKEGLFYGQCSELCGVNHGFMPIAVRFVSKPTFDQWVAKAKIEFAAIKAPLIETPRKIARLNISKNTLDQ
ncbi:MAG: cytochrome c oxidase subunit II [Rhodospirillales bacterium]|nr:cytochrome c oxidase subunit II [Rhodospirillales bacterium]